MDLSPGTRLGPYEVVGPLGEGGMGQVYRARDPRLGRDVAVKVLPAEFASNADRLARFQREAQALAALNHPHIGGIYGIEESAGQRALVLELVEGPTLAERLAAGPVSLDEGLLIARQIAEAVEAAHERGIIHRDLKPANIKLTPDGKVKVLDFGLAAMVVGGVEPSGAGLSHSPTLTLAATRAGIILGTAGYMAPEQAAGKNVDRRADVWSFGVVLWEMVTGRRLFDGETVSHTLADVLRAPIDLTQLPADVPLFLRELLRRCLDRDPATRLRDIGEARVAIQHYLANPVAAVGRQQVPDRPVRRTTWMPWILAGAAASAAALLAFVHFREAAPQPAPIRFQIQPPADTAFTNVGVISPDGAKIVFDAPGVNGVPMLWVRELDSLEARPLAGTEGAAAGPFWSPDSRSVGFGVSSFPRRVKRVEVSGGAPQTLAELMGSYREGSWNITGDILYGDSLQGVRRVRASGGGQPVPVTQLDVARGEVQHAGVTFLPDGRRFLFYRAARAPEHRGVFIGSLDVPPDRQSLDRLLASDSNAVHVTTEDGAFVLFLRDGSLLAQRFDGSSVTGDAVQIIADVGSLASYGWYSASNTGMLVYRTGRFAGDSVEMVWLDRQGKRIGQLGPPADYANGLQLSTDGRKVVTARPEGSVAGTVTTVSGNRMWVADVARGVFGKVTTQDAGESSPAFAPDGQIAFTSTLTGVGDLYRVSSSGVGTPEPLLVKSATVKHPNDISPDGKFLLYDDHTNAQFQDLFVLPLDGTGIDRKPIPFVATAADETFGQFSPDGRWIAYSTNEGGRREVVVQGFAPDRVPAAAVGKWIISSAGGDKPRWSADGRELYYIAPDRKLMVVPVKIGATFDPGIAVPLFELPVFFGFFPYDVAPDGRFLVSAVRDAATVRVSPLTVLVNWPATLKR